MIRRYTYYKLFGLFINTKVTNKLVFANSIKKHRYVTDECYIVTRNKY